MVKKTKVKSKIWQNQIITENSDLAREFNAQSTFGTIKKEGIVNLSLIEGFYLLEADKLDVYDGRNHLLSNEEYKKKAAKQEPNFFIRYAVFKDLRERGYVVKTALKFGADFRVYDRGVKPGEDHARWVVYPVSEGSTLTWHEFAAKNRVAHSTKKKLLLAVVDNEGDVSYWESGWLRP